MTLEKGKVKIEKFDGKDFSFWKIQIENYLYQKKLFFLVHFGISITFPHF